MYGRQAGLLHFSELTCQCNMALEHACSSPHIVGFSSSMWYGTVKQHVTHCYALLRISEALVGAMVVSSSSSMPSPEMWATWEAIAEKWGISSDLWDLASLFQDLPGLTSDLDAARNAQAGNANEAAWEVTDLQQELQEAELRANEALKKRLETQVAILNDDISHMRQDLHKRASSTTPEKLSFGQVSR